MNEIYKECIFDKNYLVSNLGNIKSIRSNKILKPIKRDRYLIVNLSSKGKRQSFSVHFLVVCAFLGDFRFDKLQINHVDGNRSNNKINNLEWISAKENVIHAHKLGLCKPSFGIKNGTAKLTESDILDIRRLKNKGYKVSWLSTTFSVSQSNIYRIINRELWKHI